MIGFGIAVSSAARTPNLPQGPNDVTLFTPSSCWTALILLEQPAETLVANDFIRSEGNHKGCVFGRAKRTIAKPLMRSFQMLIEAYVYGMGKECERWLPDTGSR